MDNTDYKKAYERQRLARERAEKILEDKARDLYEANKSLLDAYNRLKDQKAQLLHQEKLASIGQLAAGVAHEINNPTGFVKSNLTTLANYSKQLIDLIAQYESQLALCGDKSREKIDKLREQHDIDFLTTDMPELIHESIDGMHRIEDIVNSLKNFARPDHSDDQSFSINDCVENTLKLVNNEVKYKADLELQLNAVPEIKGKSGALSQVILNLIVNAADAIKDHGAIRISTRANNSNVEIKIRDTGHGIPQNLITRIFDPFFTTKDVGKGTGLGLAISHSIVKSHGGSLTVTSRESEGTEFTVSLPLPK